MQDAKKILEKYWGHEAFRDLQEDIIQKVLENRDVLALLPTGGGKSLCFQIPALLQPGICIVISPLVALMEDQVQALTEKGIKALAITGGIPFPEVDTLLDNCIYGNYKFLYLSPERLQQDLVQARIKQMNVNLVAVDESHCISEWGHDFRPAYRSIAILRELKPEANIIGLTASATKPVVSDIAEQLQLKNPVIFRKSFERKNIAYMVQFSEDKNYHLEKLLKEHEDAAIVYVRTRKATVEFASFLEKKGIQAGIYNGGLSKKEKSGKLKDWLAGKKRVMVATSAFGMGIDKANVRTVVHLQLPESIENYFQEAGRAGRDGELSKAVILTNESDVPRLQNQFLSNLPDVSFVKLVYKKLLSYFRIAYSEGQDTEHFFDFAKFCQNYDLNYLKTYNSLQLLDRTSVLQLSEQFQKKTRIQFLLQNRQLYYFLEANPHFEPIVKSILRTYGGVFENKTDINLPTVAKKAGTTLLEAVRVLNQLKKAEIVDFEHDEHDTKITFLVPREDDSTINRISPYINLQQKRKAEKVSSILKYISNNSTCRSEQLLKYFGEKNTSPCGICSVCRAVPKVLNREEAKKIYNAIIPLLEEKNLTSREMVENLAFEEQHIIKVLQLLVEKGAIVRTANNTYKLQHL